MTVKWTDGEIIDAETAPTHTGYQRDVTMRKIAREATIAVSSFVVLAALADIFFR